MDLREYLAIFIISFITNATPFFGAPYTIITSAIILRHNVTLQSLLEGITISALGATLAKAIMYSVGVILRKPLRNNKNVMLFMKVANKRSFFVALFISAVVPIFPLDDFVFLIGGTSKASIARMLFVTFLAKMIKSGVEIPLEVYGIIEISRILYIEAFNLALISSIALTILGILVFKIDIEIIYEKFKKYLKFF